MPLPIAPPSPALRTFVSSRHACATDDSRPEVSAAAASSAMRIAIGLRATSVDAINHFSPGTELGGDGDDGAMRATRAGASDARTPAGRLADDGNVVRGSLVQPSVQLMTHSASATDCS